MDASELSALINTRGISRGAIAKSLGISRPTVSKAIRQGIKSGVNVETYVKICEEAKRRARRADEAFARAAAPAQEAQK